MLVFGGVTFGGLAKKCIDFLKLRHSLKVADCDAFWSEIHGTLGRSSHLVSG